MTAGKLAELERSRRRAKYYADLAEKKQRRIDELPREPGKSNPAIGYAYRDRNEALTLKEHADRLFKLQRLALIRKVAKGEKNG